MGSSTPRPSDNLNSNNNTFRNKQLKTCTASLPFKKTPKMNDNLIHGQYNYRVSEWRVRLEYGV
jgi:hypothetical protein